MELRVLRTAAREFGFAVEVARDLPEAMALAAAGEVGAVFFRQDAIAAELSWTETIGRLKTVFPDARLIACHGYAESIDWPELGDAGAFHVLGYPFRAAEVRQSLGFIMQAQERMTPERQRSHSFKVMSRAAH